MAFLKRFSIGFLMGIADLLPGISGGTVAFVCGIFEELLLAIKSLQLGSFRQIQWKFLLSLGAGLVLSILLFSKIVYFLISQYPAPSFATLFGIVAASSMVCLRKSKIEHPTHYGFMGLAVAASLFVTFLPTTTLFSGSIAGLMVAGALAALAMLLPGISGSYLLQMLGIYPLMLAALAAPKGGFSLLAFLGFGVAFGFVVFSRLVHLVLTHFRSATLAVLVGFMLGGLRSLWVFNAENWGQTLFFALLGSLFVVFSELTVLLLSKVSSSKNNSVIK